MFVDIIDLVIFSLAFTGLVCIMFLLLRLNRSYLKAKLFFFAFVIIQSLNILYAFSILTGFYSSVTFVIQLNHFLQLLTPVTIYLFSYFLTNPQKKIKPGFYFLLLPALLMIIYLIPFYSSSPADKITFQESILNDVFSPEQKTIFIIKTVFGIAFIVLSALELKKHEKRVFNFYSVIKDKTHWWLRNALFSFLVIWLTVILAKLVSDSRTVIIVLAILVGLMNLYLLFYFDLYIQPLREKHERLQKQMQRFSIEKTDKKIVDEEFEKLKTELLQKVKDKKPFLNPKCNLNCFSEELDFKPYLVSIVLNKALGTNFYDFISEKRAEEAAKLLTDNTRRNLTVDAIANECGFNSKATFYKAFKKKFQCTPSQYQKNHQQAV